MTDQSIIDYNRQLNVYRAAASAMKEGPEKEKLKHDIEVAQAQFNRQIIMNKATAFKEQLLSTVHYNQLQQSRAKQHEERIFQTATGETVTQQDLEKKGYTIQRGPQGWEALPPSQEKIGKDVWNLMVQSMGKDRAFREIVYQSLKENFLADFLEMPIAVVEQKVFEKYLEGIKEGKFSTPEQFAERWFASNPLATENDKRNLANKIRKLEEQIYSRPESIIYKNAYNWAEYQAKTGGHHDIISDWKDFLLSPGGISLVTLPIASYGVGKVAGGAAGFLTGRATRMIETGGSFAGKIFRGAVTGASIGATGVGAGMTAAQIYTGYTNRGIYGATSSAISAIPSWIIGYKAASSAFKVGYNYGVKPPKFDVTLYHGASPTEQKLLGKADIITGKKYLFDIKGKPYIHYGRTRIAYGTSSLTPPKPPVTPETGFPWRTGYRGAYKPVWNPPGTYVAPKPVVYKFYHGELVPFDPILNVPLSELTFESGAPFGREFSIEPKVTVRLKPKIYKASDILPKETNSFIKTQSQAQGQQTVFQEQKQQYKQQYLQKQIQKQVLAQQKQYRLEYKPKVKTIRHPQYKYEFKPILSTALAQKRAQKYQQIFTTKYGYKPKSAISQVPEYASIQKQDIKFAEKQAAQYKQQFTTSFVSTKQFKQQEFKIIIPKQHKIKTKKTKKKAKKSKGYRQREFKFFKPKIIGVK